MRAGQIVKRIGIDGKRIGTYKRLVKYIGKKQGILSICSYGHIPKVYPNITVEIKTIVEIPMVKLFISDSAFRKVLFRKQIRIIHPATASWVRLLTSSAEIVQLRNFSFTNQTVICEINKVEKYGKSDILLILGDIIEVTS